MSDLPVFIRGVGCPDPSPEDPRSIPEMVLSAVEAALDDAGLAWEAIDAVVSASADLIDGLTASNVAITEVVGAVLRPETRIAADGLCAAIHAACQVLAGAYRTVLVTAHGKASMGCQEALSAWSLDPVVLQPLGLTARTISALAAEAPGERDPGWAEPRDAAVALVIASTPGGTAPVRLTGFGYDLAAPTPCGRSPGDWQGLARAYERARRLAAADGTQAEFAIVEPSLRAAHERELFLSATETRPERLDEARSGAYRGVPIAAGLGHLATAARRLRNFPPGARALAHGQWGADGQGQAVAILEWME